MRAVGAAIRDSLERLTVLSTEDLLAGRYRKFRAIGRWHEVAN